MKNNIQYIIYNYKIILIILIMVYIMIYLFPPWTVGVVDIQGWSKPVFWGMHFRYSNIQPPTISELNNTKNIQLSEKTNSIGNFGICSWMLIIEYIILSLLIFMIYWIYFKYKSKVGLK